MLDNLPSSLNFNPFLVIQNGTTFDVCAVNGLVEYLHETQKIQLNHINKITTSDLELQKMTLTIINPILLEVLKEDYLLTNERYFDESRVVLAESENAPENTTDAPWGIE